MDEGEFTPEERIKLRKLIRDTDHQRAKEAQEKVAKLASALRKQYPGLQG